MYSGIGQVAVVGVPDERLGEVGYAFVVPAAGTDPDPGEILLVSGPDGELMSAPCRDPRRATLNASNKVLKFELRDRDPRPRLNQAKPAVLRPRSAPLLRASSTVVAFGSGDEAQTTEEP